MKTPFASRNLAPAARRRVELAIAVAQERLLGAHVSHALDLIELVGDQVPFDDALDIFNRLLRISDDEARTITTRALASLGERSDEPRSWPERMAQADAAADARQSAGSLFNHLRQRLRGRIHEELRIWIELEAARTEVALLETHVTNALNFVQILDTDVPFAEAVELYLEALDVRDSVAEVIYYIVLARLSDSILPPSRTRPAAEPEPTPANAPEERHLRVIEQDAD